MVRETERGGEDRKIQAWRQEQPLTHTLAQAQKQTQTGSQQAARTLPSTRKHGWRHVDAYELGCL